jgi:LPS export ABC transporter protein LptC
MVPSSQGKSAERNRNGNVENMLKACGIHVANCFSPLKRASGPGVLSRPVFLTVALLAALILSAGCSQKAPVSKAPSQPLPVGPDQIFINARFVVTENGTTSAVVSADSVMVFQLHPRSIAEGHLRVLFFSREGEKISTLTSERGIVYGMTQAIDSLRAEGNVVVFWHARNARMETPFIRWISSTRRIFADSTVALTVDNAIEHGVGMEAPDDLKSYTMHQVTGSVTGQDINIPGRNEKADSTKTAPSH